MKATTKDMRFSPKSLLDAASRGEEVVITYRGKPCAKMVPLEKRKEKDIKEHPLFGIWREHKKSEDVHSYVRNLRKSRF